MRMPPKSPSRKKAAAGGTRPSLASKVVMGKSKARADKPSVVARVKGMQNLSSKIPRYQLSNDNDLCRGKAICLSSLS